MLESFLIDGGIVMMSVGRERRIECTSENVMCRERARHSPTSYHVRGALQHAELRPLATKSPRRSALLQLVNAIKTLSYAIGTNVDIIMPRPIVCSWCWARHRQSALLTWTSILSIKMCCVGNSPSSAKVWMHPAVPFLHPCPVFLSLPTADVPALATYPWSFSTLSITTTLVAWGAIKEDTFDNITSREYTLSVTRLGRGTAEIPKAHRGVDGPAGHSRQ